MYNGLPSTFSHVCFVEKIVTLKLGVEILWIFM